jgi:predicted TIM-barrel fold metal-dependent hydrolase
MLRAIDFHTHAFPDNLAQVAMEKLQHGQIPAYLDGRLSSLLGSMDKAGIYRCVVCNIATRPKQFDSIMRWCKEIASERVVPFASIHPEDPEWELRIDKVAEEGLKGIKLHPYYQGFVINEKRLLPIYRRIAKNGLLLIMHTGFDIAFPKDRIADPEKVINVLNEVPDLRLITTHLGAWDDWEEVDRHLIGKDVYMEISFSLEILNKATAEDLLLRHNPDYLLFGTDSPWTDQIAAIERFQGLTLPEGLKEKTLFRNAERLLGID